MAATPQVGIFALGTSVQCYLEFDAVPGASAEDVVATVAGLEEPHAAVGGVNLVVGLRPELWRAVVPEDCPPVSDFDEPVVGPDVQMPATQHDAFVWVSGAARDVVFDVARAVIGELGRIARVAEEVTGWTYQRNRDLTGFIDGTENPPLVEAPEAALVPEHSPGAGGSVLLIQKWVHDHEQWMALPVDEQERVIGRTKADSVELSEEVMPEDSHVS